VLSEVTTKFNMMPFNIRSLEDEKKARMGLMECVSHGLITPYEILYEKEGEFVGLFKFTVAILANGTTIISNPPRNETVKSEFKVTDPDSKALLETSLKAKKTGESSQKK